MRIEDSFVVAAPAERVWRFITDPNEVGPCIPGCEAIEVTGPRTYAASIKVQVGPIGATFRVEVEVTEEEPPHRVLSVTRGEEGTRSSVLQAQSELRLEALEEARTAVHYSSEVAVVGRLGKFGLGIMKKKAGSLGQQFAESFRTRVEAVEVG
jgi:carbon monoxide dehydrogenase subunit G